MKIKIFLNNVSELIIDWDYFLHLLQTSDLIEKLIERFDKIDHMQGIIIIDKDEIHISLKEK